MSNNKNSSNKTNKKRKKINIFKLCIVVFTVLALVAVGLGIGATVGITQNMPEWDPRDLETSRTTFVYDINGEQVTQLHAGENRVPIGSLDNVPDSLINAFLAIEDSRFYEHNGVDLRALGRAVVANIRGEFGSEGASTITQQLVKNAFLTPDKTIERKLQEMVLAIQLERRYTKDEILTYYFDWIYFGHGAYGVKAAAQTYFGKELNELTLGESATLAGLVQRPNALSPYRNEDGAKHRRNRVLDRMVHYGFITETQANTSKSEEYELAGLRPTMHPYPYFVDYVVDQAEQLLEDNGIPRDQLRTSGLRIHTTLDPKVQRAAENAFKNDSLFPSPRPNEEFKVQGAMAIIDHRTGQIKGLVGGRDHVTERGLNRATQSRRQPGSAFKPIAAYAPALELGYTAASVIDDVPTEFRIAGQSPYRPTNLGGNYQGLITMREAIRRSYNVPAVKMLHEIGVDNGYEFAQRLGVPLDATDRNLSMSLGGLSNGVTPLNMAKAFGAFANEGILVDSHAITKITDADGEVLIEVTPSKNSVMSEQNAFIMTDMLRTVVTNGTGTRASLGNRPVAGKTGTTQLPNTREFTNLSGSRDVWFVGYTPELVGAVWMGYDKTDANHYLYRIYGGNNPASLWKAVMEAALKDVPVQQFKQPDGIIRSAVDSKSGLLPSELTPDEFIISELFARGTVPTKMSDIWVKGEVCNLHGKLPTEYCPDVVGGVFLKRPVPYEQPSWTNASPQDLRMELPRQECDIHGSDTSTIIEVCTHPDHDGESVRAHRGCPEEYVEERAFGIGRGPQSTCDIPEHRNGSSQRPDPENGDVGDNQEPENAQIGTVNNVSAKLDGDAIKLNWSYNGNASDVEFYIFRSTNSDFDLSSHLRIGSNRTIVSTSYRDNHNLVSGNTYYYKLVPYSNSKNELGNPSVEVSVNIP
ncbi:penicillin-binding protein 1A [Desulfitispora alkaliphila]|uniref:transglycosylase domain-containing protein n=1 Tax=Desulfitispora alkaliphila TaxID=622674 RepID=UPI003D1E13EF